MSPITIEVDLIEDEYKRLEAIARIFNVTPSEYVAWLVGEEVGRREAEDLLKSRRTPRSVD